MLAGLRTIENAGAGACASRPSTRQTTRRYFAKKGVQVEVVKLYGSMELAPLVGLADYIVDLVDTGNTLKANGLTALDDDHVTSARG